MEQAVKMNNNSIRMVAALLVFVFIAALAITFTYNKTAQKIESHIHEAQEFSLKNVLSERSTAVVDSIEGFGKYWKEYDLEKNLIGLAFMGSKRGYSSNINFFCGLDLDGKIKGLSIINQNETPGLGTRVVEVVSNAKFPSGLWLKQEKSEPWFCEQYKGISAIDKISLNKDGEWYKLSREEKDKLLKLNQITTITGSTITTSAITNELAEKAKLLKSLIVFDVETPSEEAEETQYDAEELND
jgi:Na+-translocating ferredoxin:NAD+ oxidoreductase RnfG subunit